MTTIWVLTVGEYEDSEVEGVFASLEGAKAAAPQPIKRPNVEIVRHGLNPQYPWVETTGVDGWITTTGTISGGTVSNGRRGDNQALIKAFEVQP